MAVDFKRPEPPPHCSTLDRERASYLCRAARLMAQAAETRLETERNRGRPSVVLGASVSQVGSEWLAEYHGVQGFGDSPEEACHSFDLKWQGVN